MDALSTAYDFVGLERIDEDVPPAPRRRHTWRVATLYETRDAYAAVYEAVAD